MHKLAILLKTFIGDLKYVERLIPSYCKYNIDNIPLYLIAPEADIKTFKQFEGKNIEILSEDLFKDNLATDSVHGFKPGYINQQIIKLVFWEKDFCENYFCLDSDGEFIRGFYMSDFMYDDNTPYTILVEDNELKVEPEYYKAYWKEREEKIRQIQKEVGLVDKRMLTCHGMAIISSTVLRSFKEQFLVPNNLLYIDILEKSPYEFSWYNMWLQKTEIIPIKFREPLFKIFHHENQLKDYLRRETALEDIARGFIGMNINSNWQNSKGYNEHIRYQDYALLYSPIDEYSFEKLVFAIFKKIKKKLVKYFYIY